ncbi:MAG: ribosome small subunit-dependent GTPase A [Gammaproteobacteria bacterium]|nr:ribosome small subunit-dependent GTPase A [Gammaproteobacteria bacterium]MBT8150899.1 ribosome small subunit-dependent GTPase A [Gammaproteobacteria bacterium]NND38321.1 ribosome small subunit-dependent GTPase A [Pseudomonadales bacterium]NNL11198.1 ribosome small subunit-dependent GTPase A [Pseudomonadales bacterium]RZV53737.1 MAG: ribosome small subunit-dependent GTPase A [Pseudomonadales bacterium]
MAKRKLSHRQSARIAKSQQALANDAGDLSTGLVIAHYGGEIDVVEQAQIGDPGASATRCKLRANLPPVVCGDRVSWREANSSTEAAVVEALLPRHSVISRPRPYSVAKPIAANIDVIVLVIAPEPAPIANLLDRYLIAAANANIPVTILINKQDLLDEKKVSAARSDEVMQLAALYSELGYKVLQYTTVDAQCATTSLDAALNGKTAILVGQSGVGKSSIINALCGNAIAAIGDISSANTKGRHTTTNAQLYFIRGKQTGSSAVIDSPGIREFALWHLEENDIIAGMPEFYEKTLQCRFRDCEHGVSDGCALQAAIDNNELHPSRVSSYRHILANRDR